MKGSPPYCIKKVCYFSLVVVFFSFGVMEFTRHDNHLCQKLIEFKIFSKISYSYESKVNFKIYKEGYFCTIHVYFYY